MPQNDLSDEQRMLREAAADFFAADAEGRRLREWRGRSPGYDTARWRRPSASAAKKSAAASRSMRCSSLRSFCGILRV